MLMYILVFAGIILRLYYFFLNRSLWIDEVYLSSSIVMKNTKELMSENLLYFQKAPLLFLLIQKIFTTLFGNSELSLRTFPLICGIASLFFLMSVFKKLLPSKVSWLALAVISLSAPLVHHSAEAKQYACDLLAASLVLFVFAKTKLPPTKRDALTLALTGATAIWLSFPIIFILAGIGLVIIVSTIKEKNKKQLILYGFVFASWIISFAVSYFITAKKYTGIEWTVYWFDYYNYFIKLIPKNLEDLAWLPQKLYRMMGYPMGLWWQITDIETPAFSIFTKAISFLFFIVFLCGVFYLLKQKKHAIVLLSPFAFVLIANSLKLYPLGERFWVFLSPIIAIIVAMGVYFLYEKIKSKAILISLCLIILAGPLTTAAQLFINEQEFIKEKRSSQREAFEYIQSNFKPGDIVYIYYTAKPGYKLYEKLYTYNFPVIVDKDHRFDAHNYSEYFSKIKQDMGDISDTKRVWFLFNYYFQTDIGEAIDTPGWYFNINKPTDNIVNWFKSWGAPVLERKVSDTHVYCFQIKK